jgi:hypothetical protein
MNLFRNSAGVFSSLPIMMARAIWAVILQLTLALSGAGGSLAHAQSVQLTPTVTATAIGCAASGNGTGHMICLEYTQGTGLAGVSWEGPPAPSGAAGIEPPGTVDTINHLGTAAGTLRGAPGCATTGDGTVGCLVVSESSSGYTFQGVALSPSANIESPLRSLDTQPATAAVGTPSCAGGGRNNGVVVCAIVISGQVYGIAFAALNNTVHTTLTALSLTNVTGNPGCALGPVTPAAPAPPAFIGIVCAVRQGAGLSGFSFAYDVAQTKVDGLQSVVLPAQTFSGDPSCAPVPNGGDFATCAIVDGAALLGIEFNPATQAMSGPQYQSLGSAPDGTWTGAVGCAPLNDFRNASVAAATPNPQNNNLVGCAALSSNGNLYHVSFDPQASRTLGVDGPFAANFGSSISCLELNIDNDQLYCGGIGTSGTAFGARLPVGLDSSAVQPNLVTLF